MEQKLQNSVLIVDDEKANLKVLTRILNHAYTIYTAKDGKSAVSRARECVPDLILLDIIMPDISGYEVLSELRKSDDTKDIPVIFITGLTSVEDEEKGLAYDAVDYISKPFQPKIVELRVRNQIRNVNQLRTIERLSNIDMLTGLSNRRGLDAQMNAGWRRAIRDKTSFAFCIIDIDNFKIFNDTYGHLQGDAALRAAAGVIQETLNQPDAFPARWGGEEFVVLLPGTVMSAALRVAEQLRENVQSLKIPLNDGSAAGITVSVGVNAVIPTVDMSIERFVSAADEALYYAKNKGRNRVCPAAHT